MKHSRDTSGFSSDSFVVGGAHFVVSLLLSPVFRVMSDSSDRLRPGDFPVFLTDGLVPRPALAVPVSTARVAGDLDLRPDTSPQSLLFPSIQRISLPGEDLNRTGEGQGSGLLASDLPAVAGTRSLRDLAGDPPTTFRTSLSSSLFPITLETLSFKLQISGTSDNSSSAGNFAVLSTLILSSFCWVSQIMDLEPKFFSSPIAEAVGFGAGTSDSTSFTVSSSGGGTVLRWLGRCWGTEAALWLLLAQQPI